MSYPSPPRVPLVRRRVSLVSMLALVTASFFTAEAKAEVRFVDTARGAFTPGILRASAGDTIVWKVEYDLRPGYIETGMGHNVVGFNGAEFGDFRMRGGISSTRFPGGTSWYRCTYHSWETASGTCIGMCGLITDKPLTAPPAPTVNSPPVTNHLPAQVTGTAEPATEVLVYRDGTLVWTGFTRKDSTWLAYVPMGSSSSHTVTARTRYPQGQLSEASNAVAVASSSSAAGDGLAPVNSVAIESALPFGSPMTIRGRADDVGAGRSGVSHVLVYIIEDLTKRVWEYKATCARCPGNTVFWSVTTPLPPGAYDVVSIVFDRVGNMSQSPFYSFHVAIPPL